MSILYKGYQTYETYKELAGIKRSDEEEPLTPVSHAIVNAHIEISINMEGEFLHASTVNKKEAKTVIPVTIASAGRSGTVNEPHPLSDQLQYIAHYPGSDEKKLEKYKSNLKDWAESPYTHPKAKAVLKYIQGGTIIDDLAASGIIPTDENRTPNVKNFNKSLIRWHISNLNDSQKSACWQDTTLFNSFQAFYNSKLEMDKGRDICLITGKEDKICDSHPKGVINASYGAKLVSINDESGFTYRGRFTEKRQAYNLGYEASQKAHHALRWVASNSGVFLGKRNFLCWSPQGIELPDYGALLLGNKENKDQPKDFISYRRELFQTISGFKKTITAEDDVVIACLEAATTGRLSVTYYCEQKADDFLERLEHWYQTFWWEQSHCLRQVVQFAYGAERDKSIDVDERVLREQVQRLLPCVVENRPFPADMVQSLISKCNNPLAYTFKNRNTLLIVTCAAIRKYYYDKFNKEVWGMALNPTNPDRSYLFGRLLAVAEKVERSTYKDEGREPNAIRMQSVFSQRPLYAWRNIEESLIPYYQKLSPELRAYFKELVQDIINTITEKDLSNLSKRLDDIYLLGYYHQGKALEEDEKLNKMLKKFKGYSHQGSAVAKTKNENDNTAKEEDKDESAE